MRHRVAGRKLNRTTSHRGALLESLIRGLVLEFDRKGYIVTTRAKAKFAQPSLEKMITMAATKNVANVRRAMRVLNDRDLVAKLFDKIGPYYKERKGGYTRVVRLSTPRLGDNGTRAYFGFVKDDEQVAPAAEAS